MGWVKEVIGILIQRLLAWIIINVIYIAIYYALHRSSFELKEQFFIRTCAMCVKGFLTAVLLMEIF